MKENILLLGDGRTSRDQYILSIICFPKTDKSFPAFFLSLLVKGIFNYAAVEKRVFAQTEWSWNFTMAMLRIASVLTLVYKPAPPLYGALALHCTKVPNCQVLHHLFHCFDCQSELPNHWQYGLHHRKEAVWVELNMSESHLDAWSAPLHH